MRKASKHVTPELIWTLYIHVFFNQHDHSLAYKSVPFYFYLASSLIEAIKAGVIFSPLVSLHLIASPLRASHLLTSRIHASVGYLYPCCVHDTLKATVALHFASTMPMLLERQGKEWYRTQP